MPKMDSVTGVGAELGTSPVIAVNIRKHKVVKQGEKKRFSGVEQLEFAGSLIGFDKWRKGPSGDR